MNRSLIEGSSPWTFCACLALLAAIMSVLAFAAFTQRTAPYNEPLWFMRSQVPPTDLSTDAHRLWAVDIPNLNRWAYWAALKVTGLDRVPCGEPSAWEFKDGTVYFQGRRGGANWLSPDPSHRNMEWLETFHGKYAPRRAIVAMRMVNLAAFASMLVFLWLTARMAIGADIPALATVLPFTMMHFWVTTVASIAVSGDSFLLPAFALTLFLWTRYHMKGQGVSWRSVIVVGAAAGLATSAKHPGIIMVGAFGLYLMWHARGWNRIAMPAVAAAAAFAVFVLVNPAVLMYPGARPWEVLQMMVDRREEVAAAAATRFGDPGWPELWRKAFFWVPWVPAALAGFWVLRRERWMAPLMFWCVSIIVVTLAGLVLLRNFEARYALPIELSLYFTVALMGAALALRGAAGIRHGAVNEDTARTESATATADPAVEAECL